MNKWLRRCLLFVIMLVYTLGLGIFSHYHGVKLGHQQGFNLMFDTVHQFCQQGRPFHFPDTEDKFMYACMPIGKTKEFGVQDE